MVVFEPYPAGAVLMLLQFETITSREQTLFAFYLERNAQVELAMHVRTSAKSSTLIAGAGSIGERHLRCFQRTGWVETALCEANEGVRTEVSKRYRAPPCGESRRTSERPALGGPMADTRRNKIG